MRTFDVVVLGAGSAGENVAKELAQAGRQVAVVTDGRVGGECPFVACIPSKAMLRSGQVRHLLGQVQALGAMADPVLATRPDRGFARAVERRDELVAQRDDTMHAQGLVDAGVTLVRGRGRVNAAGAVVVDDDDEHMAWTDLIVATGAASIRPPIDGLDTIAAWSSADAWSALQRPASLLVAGGGPIGCEIAQLYARFDVPVTLVEIADHLAGAEAPEIGDAIADVLGDEGVTVITGAQIERVADRDGDVRATLDDGTTSDAARLVLATGVQPRVEGLGLEQLGIDVSDGLRTDDRCRVTGTEHVWAAGDVTDVAPFTHVANYQARVVAANLLGHDLRANYQAIPRTMYTDPPVVGVGQTPEAARASGADIVVGRADLADLPRSNTSGAGAGRLVLVADRERQVLVGASAVGAMADAWIHEAVLAVRAGVSLSVLRDTIRAFPTFSEAYDVALADLLDTTT